MHKKGNILDLLIRNHMGLDKIKSHSDYYPLTDTTDLNHISLSIVIDKALKSSSVFFKFI